MQTAKSLVILPLSTVSTQTASSAWQKLINLNSIPLIISEYGQPFTHWLSGIDLVLSPPSTTFYDYSILGKSAILTDRICASRLNHASVVSDDFDPIFDHFKRPNSTK
jgi:hypothetical protein